MPSCDPAAPPRFPMPRRSFLSYTWQNLIPFSRYQLSDTYPVKPSISSVFWNSSSKNYKALTFYTVLLKSVLVFATWSGRCESGKQVSHCQEVRVRKLQWALWSGWNESHFIDEETKAESLRGEPGKHLLQTGLHARPFLLGDLISSLQHPLRRVAFSQFYRWRKPKSKRTEAR